jgi:protein SCO1/2
MIHSMKNKLFTGCLLLMLGCNSRTDPHSMPFINKPDFTPEWINPGDKQYAQIHRIPSFSFTNQDGKIITEKTVEDKIYVANFMFTRCGSICPKMTDNMKLLQKRFQNDDDLLLLSHSVTPEKDSVPILKKYALQKGIQSGKWHLLTGDKNAIYAIAKKQYFAGEVMGYYGEQMDFLHTENFILVDKQRRIRGVYNGTLSLEMERLIEDIITLKEE